MNAYTLDPKSTAAILMREHDNAWQALEYAERKASMMIAMHNALCLDYLQAAEEIRALILARGASC